MVSLKEIICLGQETPPMFHSIRRYFIRRLLSLESRKLKISFHFLTLNVRYRENRFENISKMH